MGRAIEQQVRDMQKEELEIYFRRAFELAKSVKGFVSPNPAVGAVIVKDHKIIGEGATQPYGKDHAEIVAIKEAEKKYGKEALKGATMIVTLEPHQFQSLVPPCTDAIINAGISTVYVGTKDPNPKVNGKGIETLKKAGIKVIEGFLEEDLWELNEDFFKYITTGKPFVSVKYAMTLDGKLATKSYSSQWITGEDARAYVHSEIRKKADAILVGVNTIIRDNPNLSVRIKNANKEVLEKIPIRVVIDPDGKTPENANVLIDPYRTIFITKKESKHFMEIVEKHGKEYIVMEPKEDGYFSLKEIIEKLLEYKIIHILIEGGGETIGRAIDERIVDKFYVFVAPKIVGGRNAVTIGGQGVEKIGEAITLKNVELIKFSNDILIKGYAQ